MINNKQISTANKNKLSHFNYMFFPSVVTSENHI